MRAKHRRRHKTAASWHIKDGRQSKQNYSSCPNEFLISTLSPLIFVVMLASSISNKPQWYSCPSPTPIWLTKRQKAGPAKHLYANRSISHLPRILDISLCNVVIFINRTVKIIMLTRQSTASFRLKRHRLWQSMVLNRSYTNGSFSFFHKISTGCAVLQQFALHHQHSKLSSTSFVDYNQEWFKLLSASWGLINYFSCTMNYVK